MDEVLVVRGRKAARHLCGDVDRLAHRHRSRPQARPQRLSFEELGDDEHLVVVGAGVMNGEDVRVREGGDGLRLALEAGHPVGVCANAGGSTLIATSRWRRVSRAR